MKRSTNEIVAEIKTLYGRRHEEKLQIQADMVVLRDEHGWTQRQIADATGIPQPTINNWLQAYDEGLINPDQTSRLTPASVQEASDARVAERVLKTAPAEVIERIVGNLPRERQHVVAASAGNSYARSRVEHEERERNLTPAQRKEREAIGSRIDDAATRMTMGFEAMSIVNHLEAATEKLRGLNEARAVTPEIGRSIAHALAGFTEEVEVAFAIAQLDKGPGGLLDLEEA